MTKFTDETKKLISLKRRENTEKTTATIRADGGHQNREANYKGVYKKRDKWQAKIIVNGKRLSVGCFDTQEEAAKNYDFHNLAMYGEDVYLNFPTVDYSKFKPLKATISLKTDKNLSRKLNQEVASKIRSDFKITNLAKLDFVKSAAEEYGISIRTIYSVINNEIYREIDAKLSGEAAVNVEHNPS